MNNINMIFSYHWHWHHCVCFCVHVCVQVPASMEGSSTQSQVQHILTAHHQRCFLLVQYLTCPIKNYFKTLIARYSEQMVLLCGFQPVWSFVTGILCVSDPDTTNWLKSLKCHQVTRSYETFDDLEKEINAYTLSIYFSLLIHFMGVLCESFQYHNIFLIAKAF